jgi:ubiquinone/menaquinone biosynthesis C-methylase UbiE
VQGAKGPRDEKNADVKTIGSKNIDLRTVTGFGEEWSAFDQHELDPAEHEWAFKQYFSEFPWEGLPKRAEGFDLGCGSGRWAVLVAPRVGKLHCIDPAAAALDVCRRRLSGLDNVEFHLAAADTIPLANASQDFGYSLGVLHHVPDTASALRDAVAKLKPGAPFLLYLYYNLENRPTSYRALWRASEIARAIISRLPFQARKAVTTLIATLVYWPLSRLAAARERAGKSYRNVPLSIYRNRSYYTLRTDALDRFGTRLEQRFSSSQIRKMMEDAGLDQISFRNDEPYWCACGRRASPTGE